MKKFNKKHPKIYISRHGKLEEIDDGVDLGDYLSEWFPVIVMCLCIGSLIGFASCIT